MNSMRYLQHYPEWRPARGNRRLVVSLLLSTAITASILSIIPVPRWTMSTEATPVIMELDILDKTKPAVPDSEPPPERIADDVTETRTMDESPVDDSADKSPKNDPAPADFFEWYAVLDAVVEDFSTDADSPPSLSPRLNELRRVARIRFAPVADFGPKPIWENVEEDHIGRTILRFGDCYRVLEDWRVTNRWAQENFGQYIVYCETNESGPKELPFVAQIVERYDYLRDQ